MTDRTHPTDKESPMTPKTRHDELVALLNKISEESVTASNVLADMLDLCLLYTSDAADEAYDV